MRNKLIFIACLAIAGISFTTGDIVSPDIYSMTAYAADTTISEDLSLESDMTVEGNLILTKGTLNLNGHKLTVKGDFLQSGGYLAQSGTKASLKVYGNYEISGDGSFEIYHDSVLDIDGDVIVNSSSTNTTYQSSGTLRIGGDLSVYAPYQGAAFKPYSDAVVEFKGNKTHTVYFDENNNNYMNRVAVTDGGQIKLTGYCTGFIANDDLTLAGGSVITGEKQFELNGKTVTVDGDLKIAGTEEQVIEVGKSTLIVNGNLLQESGYISHSGDAGYVKIGGNYELAGNGAFSIWNGSVYDIDGDVIINSSSTDTIYQSLGTIKIGGDLSVYAPYQGAAFNPRGDAVVEFKGNKTHTVYFDENNNNYMNKVAITDGGQIKLTGKCTGFTADSDLTLADGSTITGERTMNLNGNTVTVDGDLKIAGASEQVIEVGRSTLIVYGNLLQESGYISHSGDAGYVKIGGNYELAGNGAFSIWNGSVYDIDGDVIINSSSTDTTYQSLGTFRIGGDLSVYAPYQGAAFNPRGDAVVEFKGKKIHTVYFDENNNNYMNKVAITDGGQIKLTGKCTGFTADSDLTLADGSTITGERTMNLNGNTVTVDGDLKIAGASEQVIEVGRSTLIVYGNLLQESGYISHSGDAGYVKIGGNYELAGNGAFSIWNGSVYDIDGDVIINSSSTDTIYQSSGTIKIGGDLSVYAPYQGAAFNPRGSAVLEFKGAKSHEVYFDEKNNNSFGTLKLGVGDSVMFTGYIYNLGACGYVTASIEPKEIASVEVLIITGKEKGEGELIFKKDDEKQVHALIVNTANKDTLGEMPSTTVNDVVGDVNADGFFNIADLVTMQKWLLGKSDSNMNNWKNGDLCKDNIIDVYDFILMRKEYEKNIAYG